MVTTEVVRNTVHVDDESGSAAPVSVRYHYGLAAWWLAGYYNKRTIGPYSECIAWDPMQVYTRGLGRHAMLIHGHVGDWRRASGLRIGAFSPMTYMGDSRPVIDSTIRKLPPRRSGTRSTTKKIDSGQAHNDNEQETAADPPASPTPEPPPKKRQRQGTEALDEIMSTETMAQHALAILDRVDLFKWPVTKRILEGEEQGGQYEIPTAKFLYYLIVESQTSGVESLREVQFVSAEKSFEVLRQGLDPRNVNFDPVLKMAAQFFTHLGIAFMNPGGRKSGKSTEFSVSEFVDEETDKLLDRVNEEGGFGGRKQGPLKALMSGAADIILKWKDQADDDGCYGLSIASEGFFDTLHAKLWLSGRAIVASFSPLYRKLDGPHDHTDSRSNISGEDRAIFLYKHRIKFLWPSIITDICVFRLPSLSVK
ncbi:hypothetical protein OG21DRAFT_1523014 [Imleria badia]|nr:hypothetical protein OG21DRAFT_1523014 [Imleria badia]